MAFEIFKYNHNRDVCKQMFEDLAKDENLAARISMQPYKIRYYAKKYGYKVYIKDEYDGHSIVKVIKVGE